MLGQQILDDVTHELLEFGASLFWSQSELLRLLNRGEMDYVNRTRLLEDHAMMTLKQGQNDYSLPPNYLSVRLIIQNVPDTNGNPSWRRIYPTNLEKIAQENVNFMDVSTTSQDRPQKYFIWNNTLYFSPTPDAKNATNVYLFYKAKPIPIISPLNQNISIDEALSDGLTAYILWKAWSKEKETDMADQNKQIYYEYIGEGRRWLKKKSGDQRYRIDIDSPIQFQGGNFIPGSFPNPLAG